MALKTNEKTMAIILLSLRVLPPKDVAISILSLSGRKVDLDYCSLSIDGRGSG